MKNDILLINQKAEKKNILNYNSVFFEVNFLKNCIFCKIINENMPAEVVYENDDVIAFLDINPANKGHVLVIPKEHQRTMDSLSTNKLPSLISATQLVTKTIQSATSCHGYNVIMNNEKAAGQIVPHAHFHIIPRLEGDKLIPPIKRQKYGKREIKEYANAIKKEINSHIKKNEIYNDKENEYA